jgi:hypothetical protein
MSKISKYEQKFAIVIVACERMESSNERSQTYPTDGSVMDAPA